MVSDAGSMAGQLPSAAVQVHGRGKIRLRWRDIYFLFVPFLVPYLAYQRGLLLLNSIAFVTYFGYAGLLTLNSKRLTREQLYLVISFLMLTAQVVLQTRSGVNSSLSLIAMVVVYGEFISRIGITQTIKMIVIIYAINIGYMTLELLSQFGLGPQLLDSDHASWSVIQPLQVGTSLYMQAQASALVAMAAFAGCLAGMRSALTRSRRWLFIGSAILSLALSVINLRGTSLVSFVFAAIVIAIVKFGKKGLFALVAFFGVVAAIVSANMDAIVQVLGFRFIDPVTGFIDQSVVDVYLDLFLSVFHRWQVSPLGDRFLGQRWGADMVGEFGFGTVLYTEGLIVLLIYLTFVFYECWRAFRMPHRKFPRNAIVYANVFALILYVASLTHYTNALNIGVANLMALHIALNIALTRSSFRTEDAWLFVDSSKVRTIVAS